MPTLNFLGKDKIINHYKNVPFHFLDKKYTYPNHQNTTLLNDNLQNNSQHNMLIHGDNLIALKSLLLHYENKIDCIYIDPPYNTGNENWVYNDNVNSPQIKQWLNKVVGKENEDFSRHDKWLCMMYPRLQLLQQLLAENGVIFISIDDNEVFNLKLICDEIFWSSNFVCNFIWHNKVKPSGNTSLNQKIDIKTEYILCYQKLNFQPNIYENSREELDKKGYELKDEYFEKRGFYKLIPLMHVCSASSFKYQKSLDYEIEAPDRTLFNIHLNLEKEKSYCYTWSKTLFEFGKKNGFIEIKKNKNGFWCAYKKMYENCKIDNKKLEIIYKKSGFAYDNLISGIYSDNGANELRKIFDGEKVFTFPKPSELIKHLLQISTRKDSIILDSFIGSGTTAHAVLELNQQDGGNRKFIGIEMLDYAENITATRIKKVINGYNNKPGTGGSFDYYEIGEKLFDENKNINTKANINDIKNYIAYSENMQFDNIANANNETYLVSIENNIALFFYYEKNAITCLDFAFLESIKQQLKQLNNSTKIQNLTQIIIYADSCILTDEQLNNNKIIFKKIPRDIEKIF